MSRIVTSFYNHDINFLRLVVRLLSTLDAFSGDNYDARQNRLKHFPGYQSIPSGHFLRSLRRLEYRLYKLLAGDHNTDSSQIVFNNPNKEETRLLPWEKEAMRVLSGESSNTPKRKLPRITRYFQGDLDFKYLNPSDQREVVAYWSKLKLPIPQRITFQDTPPSSQNTPANPFSPAGGIQDTPQQENAPESTPVDPVLDIRKNELDYLEACEPASMTNLDKEELKSLCRGGKLSPERRRELEIRFIEEKRLDTNKQLDS